VNLAELRPAPWLRAGAFLRPVSSIALACALAGCSEERTVRRQAPQDHAELARDPYAAHVQDLRRRLPAGFTVVQQRPFVVIGDEDEAVVKERSDDLVRWSIDALKREYFAKDPLQTTDIFLFQDDASYRKHMFALYGIRPSTRFGFYSPQHDALLMNIATGGGTLVHEMVR
jgi:hypothetical protein